MGIRNMVSAANRFVQFAREHRRSTLQGEADDTNKAYASMVAALRELRQTTDKGVAFLRDTALDEDLGVATWAAFYLLPYDEPQATEILERIASAGIPRLSFGAQMTLREWRANRLIVE
jgi:hypothetical protein